jgi:Ca2+-binding RTX toxin-like protein
VVATASASFVLDGELASAQVVSLFRAPSELPTPTLAQAQASVGGSVFDWLGAPDAGSAGLNGVDGAAQGIGTISVVLPGDPQLSFPEPQDGALNRLSNAGPARPAAQETPTTPSVSRDSVIVPPSTPDALINISVQSSFGSGGVTAQSFNGTAGFDTFTAQADPSAANTVTISQTADGKVFLTDGTNSISLDGYEELNVNLGSANDSITIQDLSATDIADSTVRLNLGAGNDTADATNANRRHVINGGDGDDTITGSSRGDDINGDAGNDTIKGLAGADKLNGGAGADNIEGGADNDTITGGSGDDTIDGGTGDDALSGGAGNDTYTVDSTLDTVTELAGEGTDTVNSSVSFTLGANVENLTLTGSGNSNGTGNGSANTITGNSGDNTLDGGAGADTLAGGAGNDTYVVDNAGDTITDTSGTDTVQSSVTFTLGAGLENLTLTGSGNINGTGNSAANTLTGNSGNNRLDGAGGADSMSGGAGDDTYVVDNAGDTVTEAASAGTDTVESSVTFTLGANVEHLTLTGSGNINGTGNSAANSLTGNSGNNRLDGAGGTDAMSGGAGDDTYVVDDATDTVTEGAGAGTDTVESGITFTLGANLENLTLTGSSNINGTGNGLGNTITGNSGINTLTGGAGDDIYIVQNTGDIVVEAAAEGTDTVRSSVTYTISDNDVEHLTLTGSSNINATGNASANTLTGNSGINTLSGGGGDDTYVVQNTGDVVVENAAEGTDTVQSSVTFTISDDDVEHLTLTGSGNINGTGNASANTLTGNAGNNVLTGLGGADTIDGQGGIDTASYAASGAGVTIALTGAAGAGGDAAGDTLTNVENLVGSTHDDTLTGSGSDNTLTGLAGADTINAGAGNDTIIGGAGADIIDGESGADTASYAGSASGVTIVLSDTAGVASAAGIGGDAAGDTLTDIENLTGSSHVDVLTGNSGANRLDGGAGADTLTGLGGDDTYVVDNVGDTVVEGVGGGTDTVESSVSFTLDTHVENLTLTGSGNINGTGSNMDNIITGNSGANTLTGNQGSDILSGGGGTDTLIGGIGTDTLSGGEGADTLTGGNGNDDFYYGATSEGGDTVTDFDTGNDDFVFLQSAFGNLATGTLDASNFSVITETYDGTNGTSTAATSNTAGFVYDSANGVLSYDSNGNSAGGGFTIATLSSGSVAAGDIEITATSPV